MADLSEQAPQGNLNIRPAIQGPDLSNLSRALLALNIDKPEIVKEIDLNANLQDYITAYDRKHLPAQTLMQMEDWYMGNESFDQEGYQTALDAAMASGNPSAITDVNREDFEMWNDLNEQQKSFELAESFASRVPEEYQGEFFNMMHEYINEQTKKFIEPRNAALKQFTNNELEQRRTRAMDSEAGYQAYTLSKQQAALGLTKPETAAKNMQEAAMVGDVAIAADMVGDQAQQFLFQYADKNVEIQKRNSDLIKTGSNQPPEPLLDANVELRRLLSTPVTTGDGRSKPYREVLLDTLASGAASDGLYNEFGEIKEEFADQGFEKGTDEANDYDEYLRMGLDEAGFRKQFDDEISLWEDNMDLMMQVRDADSKARAGQWETFAYSLGSVAKQGGIADFPAMRKATRDILTEVQHGEMSILDARAPLNLLAAASGDMGEQDDTSQKLSWEAADRLQQLYWDGTGLREGYVDALLSEEILNDAGVNVGLHPTVFKQYFGAGSFFEGNEEIQGVMKAAMSMPDANFSLIMQLGNEYMEEYGGDISASDADHIENDFINRVNADINDRDLKSGGFLWGKDNMAEYLDAGLASTEYNMITAYDNYWEELGMTAMAGTELAGRSAMASAMMHDEDLNSKEAVDEIMLMENYGGSEGSVIGGILPSTGEPVTLRAVTEASDATYWTEKGAQFTGGVGRFHMFTHGKAHKEGDSGPRNNREDTVGYEGEYVMYQDPQIKGRVALRFAKIDVADDGRITVFEAMPNFIPRFGPEGMAAMEQRTEPLGWGQQTVEETIFELYAGYDPDNPTTLLQLLDSKGAGRNDGALAPALAVASAVGEGVVGAFELLEQGREIAEDSEAYKKADALNIVPSVDTTRERYPGLNLPIPATEAPDITKPIVPDNVLNYIRESGVLEKDIPDALEAQYTQLVSDKIKSHHFQTIREVELLVGTFTNISASQRHTIMQKVRAFEGDYFE